MTTQEQIRDQIDFLHSAAAYLPKDSPARQCCITTAGMFEHLFTRLDTNPGFLEEFDQELALLLYSVQAAARLRVTYEHHFDIPSGA